jgi:hypothetical protein
MITALYARFSSLSGPARYVASMINEVGGNLFRHLAEGVAYLSGTDSLGGGSCNESSTLRRP